MRQTVVGIFAHPEAAEATFRRLESRGFAVECVRASPVVPTTRHGSEGAPTGLDGQPGVRARLRLFWKTGLRLLSLSSAPRENEVHLRVHVRTALDAAAARELIRAAGARQAGCLGEGWTHWNW